MPRNRAARRSRDRRAARERSGCERPLRSLRDRCRRPEATRCSVTCHVSATGARAYHWNRARKLLTNDDGQLFIVDRLGPIGEGSDLEIQPFELGLAQPMPEGAATRVESAHARVLAEN